MSMRGTSKPKPLALQEPAPNPQSLHILTSFWEHCAGDRERDRERERERDRERERESERVSERERERESERVRE